MTLLSICAEAAGNLQLPIPTSVVGSSDSTVSLLYYNARKEIKNLASRNPEGWAGQIVEYTFQTTAVGPFTGTSTNDSLTITGLSSVVGIVAGMYANGPGLPSNAIVSSVGANSVVLTAGNAATSGSGSGNFTFGQSDYSLPADFKRLVDNTLWDRSRFWQMRGAMSPQDWQLYKSSPMGKASMERRWRIRLASGAAAGSSLKFSIDPIVQDNGSNLVFEYVSNAVCKSALGVLQTQWAMDTDTGIIDEDLIEMGVEWRTLERLGMDYAAKLAEYELEVDKAIAREKGQTILDMAPARHTVLIGPFNVPESGYGS